VGMFLNGDAITDTDGRGQRIVDDSFIVYFNAHDQPIEFTLPTSRYGVEWRLELDTSDIHEAVDGRDELGMTGQYYDPEEPIKVDGRSLALLRRTSSRNA
jgi:isoamylase